MYRVTKVFGCVTTSVVSIVAASLWLDWVDDTPIRIARDDLENGRVLPAYTVLGPYVREHRDEPATMVLWGHCLESMGRWPEGELVFRQIGNLSRADSRRRAATRERAGLTRQAALMWQEHLGRFPDDGESFLRYAEVLAKQDQAEEANKALDRVETMSGMKASAMALRGMLRTRQSRYSPACKLFFQLLEFDPQLEKVKVDKPFLHLHIAEAFIFGGELELGEQHARKALELKSKRAHLAYHLLGLARQKSGKLDEAAKWWDRALEIRPTHLFSLLELGGHYLRGGNLEQAADILHRAERVSDQNAEVLFSLSTLYQRLGETEKAEQYRRRFDERKAAVTED